MEEQEDTPSMASSRADSTASSLAHSLSTTRGGSMTNSLREKKERTGFGEKDIGWFGSFSLLVNNITGAGIVDLPGLFQQAGWFTPTITTLFMMCVGALSSAMLCEAMSSVPGNERFQGRIELTSLSKQFLPTWGYYVTQILLNVSLQTLNMSGIIVAAQTMDWMLLELFKWDGAVEFFPHPGFSTTTTSDTGEASPFDGSVVISLGFVVVLLLAVPLGYFNLDENMWVQNTAFVLTVSIFLMWFGIFFAIGLDFDTVPVIGSNQTQVLGTVIFNFAYVITIPSWVNEKKEHVGINQSLWSSGLFSALLYILIGFFGGWALTISGDEDLLSGLTNSTTGGLHTFAVVLSYAFPMIVLLPGIPVYSIIVRYNLIETKLCGIGWANFWGVLFPWIVAIPFCTGEGFVALINFSSLFVNGIINFIIPMLIFIAIRERGGRQGVLSVQHDQEQRQYASGGDIEEEEEEEDGERRQLVATPKLPYLALPLLEMKWWRESIGRYVKVEPMYYAWFLIALVTQLILVVIVLDIVSLI